MFSLMPLCQNVLCPLQKRQNQKCILQVPAHAISPLLNFHRDLRPQGGLFERSIVVCASHLGPAGTVHIPRHTVATRTRSIMSRPGKLGRTCSNAPRLGFLVLFILAQLLAPAETGQAGQRVGCVCGRRLPPKLALEQPKKLPHGARDGLRASCACVGQPAAIHVSSLAAFFGFA